MTQLCVGGNARQKINLKIQTVKMSRVAIMETVFKQCLKRYSMGAFGALLCLPLLTFASDDTPGPHDALQALLGALEQETKIATRTKMNIDFVPGMVSILYGKDMVDRGVLDVGEALSLVPGIETIISNDGTMQVLVRGVGSVFSSGKIKMLLNGVAFNATMSAASTALSIPTEQIERIEVIRGPGSTIYGEFAYSGVLNIVTRKKQNQVFARYGNLGRKTIGGILTRGKPGEDWHASLSFSGANDEGGVKSGPDVLRVFPVPGVTQAPGETNEKEIDRSLILHTEFKAFDLSAQWVKVDRGDYFGLAQALPGTGQNIVRRVNMLVVDAGWKFTIGKDLMGRLRAGWQDYKLGSINLHRIYPPGFFVPGGTPADFPQGVFASPNYKERKYHVGLELNYAGVERHEILFGVDWSRTKQGETYAQRNYDPLTFSPVPLGKFTGSGNWLEEGLQRRIWAVFVQDQFSVDNKLTLTTGVRFDNYDDVGGATSPRVAAVYQLSEKQTLKVQYARAFRPPTFLETSTKNNPIVSGSPNIQSETIDNYELGYIFNDGLSIGRATLFYAELHDLIIIDTGTIPKKYINKGEVHVLGTELEYVRKFGQKLKLDGNATFQKTVDKGDESSVMDVANVLGNLGIAYRLNRQYSIVGQYRYVGRRLRAQGDPRGHLDGYQTVNLTLTAKRLFGGAMLENVTLRAGVKNIFDKKIVYPATLTNFGGSVIPSYPQDYPRPGREYWLQMDARF